jgi:hypothetical protein
MTKPTEPFLRFTNTSSRRQVFPNGKPSGTYWSQGGVIKGGGVKSNKDRQIKPHIESFQQDHPSEASFIKDRVIPKKS